MPKSDLYKKKMFILLKLLQDETDEQHPLTTRKICARMNDLGFPTDRRTLPRDIALLCESGFGIGQVKLSRSIAFYYKDQSFELSELKMLIDAVEAASFIPVLKSEDLKRRIISQAGIRQMELLGRSTVCVNRSKHSNEEVFTSVRILTEAIERHRKVSFLYFDLNEKRERVYRKEGERYLTDPIVLVFNSDNYYLLAWSSKHRARTTYRVDRMEGVAVSEKRAASKAVLNQDDLDHYTSRVFRMFNGKGMRCTLEFTRTMIGQIFDKFGEDTEIREVKPGLYQTEVRVEVSPPFFGWIFQYGGEVTLVGPEEVAAEYRRRCEAAAKQF